MFGTVIHGLHTRDGKLIITRCADRARLAAHQLHGWSHQCRAAAAAADASCIGGRSSDQLVDLVRNEYSSRHQRPLKKTIIDSVVKTLRGTTNTTTARRARVRRVGRGFGRAISVQG